MNILFYLYYNLIIFEYYFKLTISILSFVTYLIKLLSIDKKTSQD